MPVIVLPPKKEESFDWRPLLTTLWQNRWLMLKTTAAFLALGLFVALFSQREYESEVVLMPEFSTASQDRQSRLGNLGGIAGLGMEGMGGLGALGGGGIQTYRGTSNAIRVELYPSIALSVPLLKELMYEPFYLPEADTTVSLYHYFTEMHRPSVAAYAYRYTLGLPFTFAGWVRGWFDSDDAERDVVLTAEAETMEGQLVRLSRSEYSMIQELRSRISASTSRDDFTFSVQARMPDNHLSAQVSNALVTILTGYVTDYRTEKIREDLLFIEQMAEDGRQRFYDAQMQLAEFRDENRGLASERARIRDEQLQNDYQLAYSLFASLTRDTEQKRVQLQEETPVFKTLEPASVPVSHSEPRVPFIVVLSVLMGIIAGAGISLYKNAAFFPFNPFTARTLS